MRGCLFWLLPLVSGFGVLGFTAGLAVGLWRVILWLASAAAAVLRHCTLHYLIQILLSTLEGLVCSFSFVGERLVRAV